MINSLYGAFANVAFAYFSINNAEAVTVSGQTTIQWVSDDLNRYIREVSGDLSHTPVFYNDTDSVAGDSIIHVNGIEQTIEEFYDSCEGSLLHNDEFNQKFVKRVDNSSVAKCFHEKVVCEKPIRYVMKHRVKKELFEVTVGERKVICTEDHSLIILRKGKYISAKPMEVEEGDQLILLTE